jgi:hypothetical protein
MAIRTTKATGKSKVECKGGREYDSTKAATALATSGSGFDSTCCKYSATCIGEKHRLASLTGVSQKDWKCRTNFYDAEATAADDYTDEDGNDFVIKADATISLTAITTEKKWHDQCCVEKMKCSEFTCDAKKGRISDRTKDANRCMNEATTETDKCDETCCKDDPKVCLGYTDPAADANNHHKEMGCWPDDRFFKDAGQYQLYDADAAAADDYTDEDGNEFEIKPDAAISLTAITTEKKWHDQCCVEKMKCSEFTCDAKKGRIADHTKDATRFVNEPTTETDLGDATCCKDDPKVCRGYTDPAADANNHHKEMGCWPSDRFFKDAGEFQLYDENGKKKREATGRLQMGIRPKTTNLIEKKEDQSHDDDFKGKCCTEKMRCEVWKDPSLAKAQTSAAKHQRTLAAAPLLMAFGVMALSK